MDYDRTLRAAMPLQFNRSTRIFLETVSIGLHNGVEMDWTNSKATFYLELLQRSEHMDKSWIPLWLANAKLAYPDRFCGRVHSQINGRKVISTNRGYYGLAPCNTQIGDMCGIIFGCKSPCILRKRSEGSGYTFIGPMYMPGRETPARTGGVPELHVFGSEESKDWTIWDGVEEEIIVLP
jgi:hypothetical protein